MPEIEKYPRIEMYPEDGSALLHIDQPDIVEQVRANAKANDFVAKSEFHVTVLPRDTTTGFNEDQIDGVRSVLLRRPVRDLYVMNELLLINKPKVVGGVIYPRESLIARVHSGDILRRLGNLAAFLPRINASDPFLHVTLFTRGNNEHARRGIGIASTTEFESMHAEPYPL